MTSNKRSRVTRQDQQPGSRQLGNQPSGRARRAQEAQRRHRLRIFWLSGTGTALAAIGIGIGLSVANSGGPPLPTTALTSLGLLRSAGSPGPLGPEEVPIPAGAAVAPATNAVSGSTIDGISCDSNEQTLFHFHTHLTIFINGKPRQVPYGIGIAQAQTQSTSQGAFVNRGSCFYWLHTHAADGIIHIESPVQRTFTLGNFFDIWGVRLGPDQVGSASGRVTAIFNGRHFIGNVRDIPLDAHSQIQLEVGTPLVTPLTISFPAGI